MSPHHRPSPAVSPDLAREFELSLTEVSRACAVEADFVIEMVQEGVIVPRSGRMPEDWRFASSQLRHVAVTARLQRDLGVNLPGAALVLQLLDEVETLRALIEADVPQQDGD